MVTFSHSLGVHTAEKFETIWVKTTYIPKYSQIVDLKEAMLTLSHSLKVHTTDNQRMCFGATFSQVQQTLVLQAFSITTVPDCEKFSHHCQKSSNLFPLYSVLTPLLLPKDLDLIDYFYDYLIVVI